MMPRLRIQSFHSLRDEMIAVARGERRAPRTAGQPSVHSAEVLARLLTPQNRRLMMAIRDKRPASIAELAKVTHRAAPNLVRTLDKLVALGLVHYETAGRSKAPRVTATKITIEIDPYSTRDVISVTPVRGAERSRTDRRAPAAVKRSTRGKRSPPGGRRVGRRG